MIEISRLHASAFGASFTKENKQKLIEYFNNKYKETDMTACYHVDFEFDYKTEYSSLVNCINSIGALTEQGIYGQGFFEPLIAIKNIPISNNINIMGKNQDTMKITCNNIAFMKFKSKEEDQNQLKPSFGEKLITVVGTCNLNKWAGRTTPQIFIEDYEVAETKKWIF